MGCHICLIGPSSAEVLSRLCVKMCNAVFRAARPAAGGLGSLPALIAPSNKKAHAGLAKFVCPQQLREVL